MTFSTRARVPCIEPHSVLSHQYSDEFQKAPAAKQAIRSLDFARLTQGGQGTSLPVNTR